MKKHFFILLIILFSIPIDTFAQVEIVEVMCKPSGDNPEWIKIKNKGGDSINIAQYILYENSNKEIVSVQGDSDLNSGEEAIILDDNDESFKSDFSGDVYVVSSLGLNNSGERIGFGTEYIEFGAQDVDGELCNIISRDTVSNNSSNTNTSSDSTTSINNTQTQITTKEVIQYKTVTIQPPEDIYIREIANKSAIVGSSINISAEVYDATGAVQSVGCSISFGDGSEGKRCQDSHIYNYAGQYVVVISVTKGTLHAKESFIINVQEPKLLISVDKDNRFVEIFNKADTQIELNNWQVKIGYKRYKIPKNTIILPNNSIKLSDFVMGINISRLGGKAELINAINKIVANSVEYELINKENQNKILALTQKQEVIEDQQAEKSSQNPKTNVIDEKSQKQEESQKSAKSNIINKNSIIGTRVESSQGGVQKTGNSDTKIPIIQEEIVQDEATKEEKDKTNISEYKIEDFKNDNLTSAYTAISIIPNNAIPWLIGLVSLIGLAIAPIFVKSKNLSKATQENKNTSDINNNNQEDKISTFTITEIK